MSYGETPKQVANVAAATAPLASYLSGVSLAMTILASIVSIFWMGFSTWKMLSPESFDRFVVRLNRKR